MSSYSFQFNGQTFQVKVPQGVTEEQAQALFKQQADTGSLVGFNVGESLSAATQAAAGLPGAVAQLSQGAAGALGALGAGTNLNSITAGLGAAAGAVKGQISSALTGGAAALNSLTTGAGAIGGGLGQGLGSLTSSVTSAVGSIGSAAGIIGGLTSGAGGALGSIGAAATAATGALSAISSLTGLAGGSALTGALTGAAGAVGSLASTAAKTMQGAIGAAATNGINVADFAKQIPALGAIGGLSAADVTGTLAQASKLVGQGASTISNALGVGKFGFDAPQLEKAGLVKPGTAAAFLAQGDNDIVSVLKSPTVWTGKEGVKSLDGLLSNAGLQDKVQQDLMKTGLDGLKSVGIPTDKFSPQALSGLATNAAKSVTDTVSWAKNAPGLPAEVKDQFNAAATNGAFAVNFTQTKVDPPVLQETKPEPAANTVNAETQNAAANRVVGNDKVPPVSAADSSFATAQEKVQAFLDVANNTFSAFQAVVPKIDALEQSTSVTQEQIDAINAEVAPARAVYNSRAIAIQKEAVDAVNALPDSAGKKRLQAVIERIQQRIIPALVEYVKIFKQRLKDLAAKIST
jgi:hypothetical protein